MATPSSIAASPAIPPRSNTSASMRVRTPATLFSRGIMARDPGMIVMMLMFPIIQLLIFGFAINSDPRHLPLAVESNDNSAFSRAILSSLRNTGYFDLIELARH